MRVIDEVGGYEYDIAPLTEEEQAEAVTNRERYIKRADAAKGMAPEIEHYRTGMKPVKRGSLQ